MMQEYDIYDAITPEQIAEALAKEPVPDAVFLAVSYTHLDVYKRQILGGVKVYRRLSNSECHKGDARESDCTR